MAFVNGINDINDHKHVGSYATMKSALAELGKLMAVQSPLEVILIGIGLPSLFDALGGGAQTGVTVTRDDMTVTGGIFTVTLNFGAGAFPGADRFLEISVRPGAQRKLTAWWRRTWKPSCRNW